MYERYKICSELNCGEMCFRAQRYEDGNTVEVFHEHIPSHRISSDSAQEVLRSLIGLFSGWDGVSILRSRLNNRSGGPSRGPCFSYHDSYPEEGVHRRYLRSGNVTAWVDTVVSPGSFRREEEPQNDV